MTFMHEALTKEEFNKLKLHMQTHPSSHPLPSFVHFSQYPRKLFDELKDILSTDVWSGLKEGFYSLIVVAGLLIINYALPKIFGFDPVPFSVIAGVLALVFAYKYLFLLLGVLNSLANFTHYFFSLRRFYRKRHKELCFCPDYDTYWRRRIS